MTRISNALSVLAGMLLTVATAGAQQIPQLDAVRDIPQLDLE